MLSEIIDSILMWSHYSYNHTGFALGYDLRSLLLPNDKNLGLFPVIYSDKRYNAEEFLLYLSGFLMHAPVHTADKMSSIKLKPNSIYYGCHIAQEKYNKLHEISRRKGIEEHVMTLDNASDEYRMRVQ